MGIKVWHLVYIYHILSLIVCLYSETDCHNLLFREKSFKGLYLPFIVLLSAVTYRNAIKGPGFANPRDSLIDGIGEDRWYCPMCQFSPPLRSSHCKKCGRCVLRRDHHCPWLGCCVGMENHLYFVLFLFVSGLAFKELIAQSLPVAMSDCDSFIAWLFTGWACAIIVGIGVFGIVQGIALFPLHLILMGLNLTTWEFLRSSSVTYLRDWKLRLSPFSRGFIGNITEFLTMHRRHPVYEIPVGESLDRWKRENSFLVNDSYECC